MREESQIPKLVIVTGLSGAGRNTALNALEDCGYHRIDNLPPSLLERMFSEPMEDRRLALGFGALAVEDYAPIVATLKKLQQKVELEILFVEAGEEVLIRRYSETRRSHPNAGHSALREGIARERNAVAPLRSMASIHIDTSELNPHQLKAEIKRALNIQEEQQFLVNVISFSYKRGVPREADLVFDCRFLRNPHWEDSLREKTGLDQEVQSYVSQDKNSGRFLDDIGRMMGYIVPAVHNEGRSYFSICLGCSGGRHRSVAMAEKVSRMLKAAGWQTNIIHREIDAGM